MFVLTANCIVFDLMVKTTSWKTTMHTTINPTVRQLSQKRQSIYWDFSKPAACWLSANHKVSRSEGAGVGFCCWMSLCLCQAPVTRCHCRPLLHKLEDQLRVTQDQFKRDVLKVQEQVEGKISRMDQRSRHQVRFCTFSTLTGLRENCAVLTSA